MNAIHFQHRLGRQSATASSATVAAFVAMSLLVAGLPGADTAFGQCQYAVQEIVPPSCQFGGPPPLIARGLNNLGHVVGDFADCNVSGVRHPFLWTEEQGMTIFPLPDGVFSGQFHDINDHGIIVGAHSISGEGWKGFVFDPRKGEYEYLEPLHDDVVATCVSHANAINNSGIVAGSRAIGKPGAKPMPQNAVIWDTNTGEVQDLGVFSGPNSWSAGINDASQAAGGVGTQFFNNADVWVLSADEVTLTGLFPGGQTIGATGINSFGVVVVAGQLADQSGGQSTQSALWHEGQWEMLPHSENATGAGANAINDIGQVTGRMQFGSTAESGVLWQHGDVYLLGDLLVEGEATSPIERGRAINNVGQILVRIANTKGGLLTPVDVQTGDLNYDCAVNAHDLLIMLAAWGPQPPAARGEGAQHPADLNGDGVVNVSDLLILLGHWTP